MALVILTTLMASIGVHHSASIAWATPRRQGSGGCPDTGDHTPRQGPQRSNRCAGNRGRVADTVSCRGSTGVLHAKKARPSRAEPPTRPTSPPIASLVSALLVPDREGPTACQGWRPHPHAWTPNPRERSNPLETQLVAHPDVGGAGRVPVRCDDTLTFVAGPGDSRSEVFWGTVAGGRYRLARGTTVSINFQVRHHFSDPRTRQRPDPKTWHTIFQLHGPTRTGSWPTPPVTISWQNGTYRVGGGAAVPDNTGQMRPLGSWFRPYATAPEDRWRTIKLTAYLDGPQRGSVSMWIDNHPYISGWRPRAGTMYVNAGGYSHREINLKSGLYTGTNSPRWSRIVQIRDVSISTCRPAS